MPGDVVSILRVGTSQSVQVSYVTFSTLTRLLPLSLISDNALHDRVVSRQVVEIQHRHPRSLCDCSE